DDPLVIDVSAVNGLGPPQGDARLQMSLDGVVQPFDVPVQQPAVSMSIDLSATTLGVGETATLSVTDALNGYTGHEPRIATWSITPANAVAWLTVTNGGATATVTAPTDPATLIATGSVTVTAHHAFAGSTATASRTISLTGNATHAKRCYLSPTSATLGL